MNKVMLILFGLIWLNIPLFALIPNNSYTIDNIEKSEKEFITMLYDDYAKHKIIIEKKRLARIENNRLEKIEEAKILQAKREQRLKIEENKKRLVVELKIELEKKRIEEKRLHLKRKKLEVKSRNIFATIDISKQKMKVFKGKKLLYTWKVSTGKNGYRTPRGNYKPTHITKMHYSRKYNNSPMPYSVFFHGGYAVHGTKSVSRLGRRASHGCIRLHTTNAKKFYSLVRKYGKRNTKIKIVN